MIKPAYEVGYYRGREGWPDFREEVRTIRSLARLSPDSRVLEVGCGSGELLKSLARDTRFITGVDLSTTGLGIAKEKATVACARAESLPFRSGSFDAVVSQHLIEHLPDTCLALREWHRVLRPEGRLVLVTPNAAYPDPAIFADPTHQHLFTPASLRHSLEKAGYRVDTIFTLFPYLGRGRLARSASIRLASLARVLPWLSATGRSLLAAATTPFER